MHSGALDLKVEEGRVIDIHVVETLDVVSACSVDLLEAGSGDALVELLDPYGLRDTSLERAEQPHAQDVGFAAQCSRARSAEDHGTGGQGLAQDAFGVLRPRPGSVGRAVGPRPCLRRGRRRPGAPAGRGVPIAGPRQERRCCRRRAQDVVVFRAAGK